MTARKKTPAKRGRKPAAPGAKLSQLTIRLPPTQRLGLELLARELGISISQVVERALAQTLATWPVAGRPAAEQVMSWNVPNRKFPPTVLEQEAVAEEILDSEPLFVMHLPYELRRDHEPLFAEVVGLLASANDGATPFPINSNEATELLELCKLAFRRGVPAQDVLDQWNDLTAEAKR